jgi:glyoxylase-like metal-dependent hydrolase (beta-lactamase superfamily II)
MIFRQLFDSVSGTYSYLLASRAGGEALIIDPVLEKVDRYLQLIGELDVRLVKAVDTHLHADHITGLGALRDRTHCITVMGENTKADVVSMRLSEGDKLTIEGVSMDVLYTPGHTDDSYSFLMGDRVFTGDTLLIRGTGRTDFQNGDARAQYESLFGKLLRLPDETLVFRRGEALQSAPAGQIRRRLCRADGQPQPAQSEDDGRRRAVQHEGRVGAAGYRAPRLGLERRAGDRADRPERSHLHRSARAKRMPKARQHPRRVARALWRSAEQYPRRRPAA